MSKGNEFDFYKGHFTAKRTDVRDKTKSDVSRETLAETKVKPQEELSNVADEKGNPGLKELYRHFRNNGLNVVESGYNALYLKCSDNYYSSDVGVKERYQNVYAHPSSWFANATTLWKHNKWSVAVKALELPAFGYKLCRQAVKRVMGAGEVFVRGVESSGSMRKSASGLLAVILLVGMVSLGTYWWSEVVDFGIKTPALQLYVDGEHVGNVKTINEVNVARGAVEASITMSLGMPYTLECDIGYKAVRAESSLLLNEAKLNKVLHQAAHEEMKLGYCLYKGDLPICAVEDKTVLEQAMELSIKQRYPHLFTDDNVKNVGYKDFIIRQGSYPEDAFVNENELYALLSVDASGGGGTDAKGVSVNKALITEGHSVGISSDVSNIEGNVNAFSVKMETVVTRTEIAEEVQPFLTEYIYDETIAEGTTIIISAGRNGARKATYAVDYIDGKETSRRLLDEELVYSPVNAVVKKGTRPLTEEEKQYISTGTYIYPSAGTMTSTYGWRVLRGQNEFHKGLDMNSDAGLDLVASDAGTVIQARDAHNGYGLCILIEHDDGTITRYAHCSKVYVKQSQRVKQGQLIAKMGSTGNVTGVHLHFEIIKDGKAVDPRPYLIQK